MTSASFSTSSIFESLPDSNPNTSNGENDFSLLSAGLLESLPIACAIFNKNGNLTCVNARFLAPINQTACNPETSELLIREIFDQRALSNESRLDNKCQSFGNQAQSFSNLVQSQILETAAKNGHRFTASILPVSVVPGEQHHIILLQESPEDPHDTHRQRSFHARLLHATQSQSVGEMTTILSHELNQPLGAIANYLDAAQKILGDNENVPSRAKEALRLAQVQANQAGSVVARIREFVSSRQPLLEPCEIGSLIRNTLELMQWDLQKFGIKYRQDIADDLPLVNVDSILLGQVLTNLVNNAIDAMQSTPLSLRRLWISASVDLKQRIIVNVRDTGTGISSKDHKNLFNPFFTTKPRGMGIGLSISRSIMELHAGSLYHETNIDHGSSFCFTLPTQ